MSKRTPYEDLILMPEVIADTVATSQYTGCEMSDRIRCGSQVEKTEMLRSQMTREQRQEFVQAVDKRCRLAYEAKADWFIKCIRSKSNHGRDTLYNWVRHWLASYLNNPAIFLRTIETV